MPLYRGRFAPSPTGPLHMGSIVTAMASYCDAKAHQGMWLVRMEDNDFDRNIAGMDQHILRTLQRCGMYHDETIVYQSQRTQLYENELTKLSAHTFACACSRKDWQQRPSSPLPTQTPTLAKPQSHPTQPIYLGTCRLGFPLDKPARSLRLRVPDAGKDSITFEDRWYGTQTQHLANEVGDFVLKRADGFWAYQFACVVDDALQHITHIVRGADLLDSTQRQIYLQGLQHYPTPIYGHIPLVLNEWGEKLSKQTGGQAVDTGSNDMLKEVLYPAAQFLKLPISPTHTHLESFWKEAIQAWATQYL